MNNDRTSTPNIPPYTWKRPIGLGWENPYTVRYASNLDDGPWHGMPLGGFGAGCIGRSSRGDFNLWHIDGGEHIFRSLPACQFSVFEETQGKKQAFALSTEPPTDGSLSSWKWYPCEGRRKKEEGSPAAELVPDVTDRLHQHEGRGVKSKTGTYHA